MTTVCVYQKQRVRRTCARHGHATTPEHQAHPTTLTPELLTPHRYALFHPTTQGGINPPTHPFYYIGWLRAVSLLTYSRRPHGPLRDHHRSPCAQLQQPSQGERTCSVAAHLGLPGGQDMNGEPRKSRPQFAFLQSNSFLKRPLMFNTKAMIWAKQLLRLA